MKKKKHRQGESRQEAGRQCTQREGQETPSEEGQEAFLNRARQTITLQAWRRQQRQHAAATSRI